MSRNAILFGAGPALGLEVGRRLIAEQYRLHLVGRSAARLSATGDELRALGGWVTEHHVDLADPVAAAQLVADIRDRLPSVDVVVYAPGDPRRPPVGVDQLDAGELETWLPLQLLTPLSIVNAVLPGMRARNRGAVVVAQDDTVRTPAPTSSSTSIPQAALLRYLMDVEARLRAERSAVHVASLQIGGVIERSSAAELLDRGQLAAAGGGPQRRILPEQLAELVWRVIIGDERLLEVRA